MVDFYLICLTNCDNVNQYQNCALILWPTKLKSRENTVLILKVSKSQKHFFLKLYCSKNERKYNTKLCLMKLEYNFVKYFLRFFWAMEFQEVLRFTDL